MDLLWYLLPGIMFVGIATAYEDWRSGKIRNHWILGGMVYAALVYASVFFLQGQTTQLNVILLNVLIAIIVAYGLWHFDFWSAGDGKLFICYASLLPLSVYENGYQPYFPALTILLNTFFIGFIYVAFHVIRSKHSFHLADRIKALLSPRQILISALYIFSGFWAITMISSYLQLSLTIAQVFLIGFALFSLLEPKAPLIITLIIIALIRPFLDPALLIFGTLAQFIVIIVIWQTLRHLVLQTILSCDGLFKKAVDTPDLKPGMILCRKGSDSEGLTEQQITSLRKTDKYVYIRKTIPFAPLMLIGAIVTILCKGNILIFLSAILW